MWRYKWELGLLEVSTIKYNPFHRFSLSNRRFLLSYPPIPTHKMRFLSNSMLALAVVTAVSAAVIEKSTEKRHNAPCNHQYCLSSRQRYHHAPGSYCRPKNHHSNTKQCSSRTLSCSVCNDIFHQLNHACSSITRCTPTTTMSKPTTSSQVVLFLSSCIADASSKLSSKSSTSSSHTKTSHTSNSHTSTPSYQNLSYRHFSQPDSHLLSKHRTK